MWTPAHPSLPLSSSSSHHQPQDIRWVENNMTNQAIQHCFLIDSDSGQALLVINVLEPDRLGIKLVNAVVCHTMSAGGYSIEVRHRYLLYS